MSTPMDLLYLGDRVVPVVIGAVIALAGTLVVQLLVVPRVEARKRREQRWEQDVREMGELLTFDLSRAVRTISIQLSMAVLVLGPRADDKTKADAHRRAEHERELKAAAADLSAANLRLDWLRQRICNLAELHPRTREFARKCRHLYVVVMMFETLEWKLRPSSNEEFLTQDEVDETREKLDRGVRDVLEVLKRYGTGAPPRNSIRHRAGHRARKVWARICKTTADAQPEDS